MREREIEQTFVKEVRKVGGIAVKLVSPGYDGMPDRLVLMPGGKVFFAELKRLGAKPRPLQESRHRMLRNLGFTVLVIDDKKRIEEAIHGIQTT